jgi:adenosyl cobinamide kinase/adenosyl cobinamide phosphate guanylyltransferase
LLKTVDTVGSALGKDFNLEKGFNKSITNLIFDPEETAAEADKTIEETKTKLAQLRNEAAGFTNAINDMDKAEAKSSIDANKEKNDIIKNANAEAARLAIEQRNELDKKLEDIAEQNYQNSLSEQEREIRLIQDKYFELETLAQGNAQALQDIEIAKLNEINDVNLKYQQQAYEAEKAAKEKQKELDAKSNQDKIDAQKAVAETLATIRQQDFNNIEAGLDLVSSLFENNKKIQAAVLVAENAVGIAKTIVNTQAANQLARAQGTALAIASGGASVAAAEALVVRNNIGAGISIAAQIAATAKGLSALKAGGSPASGSVSSGGGGGGGMSPNFNVVGNSGMNQLAQIQQTPIQAYVVSGEVTSAQALDRNRVKNATL